MIFLTQLQLCFFVVFINQFDIIRVQLGDNNSMTAITQDPESHLKIRVTVMAGPARGAVSRAREGSLISATLRPRA